MAKVLIHLSIIAVLLINFSGAVSIEIPMYKANSSNLIHPYSRQNTTEDKYFGIVIMGSNQTTIIRNYTKDGVKVADITINISNVNIPYPTPNITCTRRDYEEDIAAVFREKVGPIDTAYIVFNTTYNNVFEGLILNTTELIGLKMLNETTVECNHYLFMLSSLRPGTIASLLGSRK